MYTLFLILAITLGVLAFAGSLIYSIVQVFAWSKAGEISKNGVWLAPIMVLVILVTWHLLAILIVPRGPFWGYIVYTLISLIPFFLPSKCYRFSVYYSIKWLGWFNRWRTFLLLIVTCICAYFTGYSIRWQEQYILEHAKEYVIGNMTSEAYLEDDVNYITVTGGDGVIYQVSGKTQKEGIRLSLIPLTGSDNMHIFISGCEVSREIYEIGDTVRIFNSQIVK